MIKLGSSENCLGTTSKRNPGRGTDRLGGLCNYKSQVVEAIIIGPEAHLFKSLVPKGKPKEPSDRAYGSRISEVKETHLLYQC